MQQYFVEEKLEIGKRVRLDDDILYHLVKVLRKDSRYAFRLADCDGRIFLCHLLDDRECLVDSLLDENNELEHDITCILALVKSDKFELCLQKLTELGVSRIVPYNARRSVMKVNDEKKLSRFRKIVREAAEQSHRNIVPEITSPIGLKDIVRYKSEINYICYESERNIADMESNRSVTYIIGPEGGFAEDEYEKICQMGFESISLGKRILRAETAAIYMTSVIVSHNQ